MSYFSGTIHSTAMEMKTQVNIIFPRELSCINSSKVVYLLHGLSDNANDWMKNAQLGLLADTYQVIFILPEVQRSFYTDMAYGIQYFTYITEELPQICSQLFHIPQGRENTYVMGLSMGGYGALKSALKKPGQYAGCAAFSAACDLEEIVTNSNGEARSEVMQRELKASFGMEYELVPENDLFRIAKQCEQSELKPRIFMTCGTEDFIYHHSVKFRDFMAGRSFDYTYQEWSGEHEWYLWNKSLHLACAHFFERVTETDHCNIT